MDEKQLFSVLVRAIGLAAILHALGTIVFQVSGWLLPAFSLRTAGLSAVGVIGPSLICALVAVVLGAIMMRWPEWLVRLAWLEQLPTIGRMEDY